MHGAADENAATSSSLALSPSRSTARSSCASYSSQGPLCSDLEVTTGFELHLGHPAATVDADRWARSSCSSAGPPDRGSRPLCSREGSGESQLTASVQVAVLDDLQRERGKLGCLAEAGRVQSRLEERGADPNERVEAVSGSCPGAAGGKRSGRVSVPVRGVLAHGGGEERRRNAHNPDTCERFRYQALGSRCRQGERHRSPCRARSRAMGRTSPSTAAFELPYAT